MGIFSAKNISTQQHLDIDDIRDDVVLLRGGRVSLVIETTSLNFELLANREQDTRIYTFAGLLNSLHFPIQIVIRTQQKDVSKYKELLQTYKQRAGANAVRSQIEIYEEFITNLTDTSVILDKRFYAIIPTVLSTAVQSGGLRQLFGKSATVYNPKQTVAKALLELNPKRDHLIKQFSNMGLAARQLTNDELIRLYYSIYEPDKAGLDVLNLREEGDSDALLSISSKRVQVPTSEAAQAGNPFGQNQVSGGQVNQVSQSSNQPPAAA